ncbi:TIGR02587 family membrane protein [Oculatella sp. LEGE 06141]|uniref:TIGR02587 family membrane protein n=1 Tax=Oculatella sp. LEGE 06141 TaxID=1828648 RepID=UPI0018807660|nr:TIGR02587 family membrane protein [Oculatella sp. LEGE 06141]MBE9181244.1 TIGR02587 family membrane protein [Oculatella sp. LEGE 06141]
MGTVQQQHTNGWKHEIDDVIRGACGGFLFGIPLLYTMEVWWIGSYSKPLLRMMAIATAFVVVFLLNRTGGFRRVKKGGLADSAMDSVEAIAIGLVCTTLVLVLLQEITLTTQLGEALGKLIFESVPFTLGVALANQVLSADDDSQTRQSTGGTSNTSSEAAAPSSDLNATLSDIGATLIGAIIVAFNIAPTDEVPMLAAAVSGVWLLLMILASLVISYGIVFYAGFSNQKQRMQQKGVFQRPSSETVMAYLVSLASAALMLWFFQKLTLDDPWTMWLDHTLILGLPAAIGGAAGRLAV